MKVQQKEYPELPATEYLCNQIARMLGVKVPDFYFIRFQDVAETFVSKNFMQNYGTSNLVHLYHFVPNLEDFNCKTILQVIADKVGHLAAIEHFIRTCLFDALIGNHDRHGRNLALIQTPQRF